MSITAEQADNAQRFRQVSSAWVRLLEQEDVRDRQELPLWEGRCASTREEQAELIRNGRWRGGPRTLLGALGLHTRELAMTAGLAWLVRPDGHHGLGDSFLRLLLERLGLSGGLTTEPVQVQLEETRNDTRADLVVYGNGWTLVIEVKIYAVEQPDQLDRLHAHWADEPGVHFIFLTPGKRIPTTNSKSRDAWIHWTWSDLSRSLRLMVSERDGVAPGVLDYLTTLEAYHNV